MWVTAGHSPARQPGQSLRDAIAVADDDSLFAWVVKRFGDGWLVCDDGPGEVADFLHIANDGTLTIIHVKAAGNHSPGLTQHNTNGSVIAAGPVVDLRPLRLCVRDAGS
jgi:hypothetical protein